MSVETYRLAPNHRPSVGSLAHRVGRSRVVVDSDRVGRGVRLAGQDVALGEVVALQRVVVVHLHVPVDELGPAGPAGAGHAGVGHIVAHAQGALEYRLPTGQFERVLLAAQTEGELGG